MNPNILARARAAGRLRPFSIGALAGAWIERDARHRQMRQLAKLDDHMLRDIGVTRDDVPSLGY